MIKNLSAMPHIYYESNIFHLKILLSVYCFKKKGIPNKGMALLKNVLQEDNLLCYNTFRIVEMSLYLRRDEKRRG